MTVGPSQARDRIMPAAATGPHRAGWITLP
jgi:hypothetical protein